MSELTSNSMRPLRHADFDLARVDAKPVSDCPVRDCSEPLVRVLYGKQRDRDGKPKERTKLWCPRHGIRLHSGSFVYWNGPDTEKESQLRNLMVEQDLATQIALEPGAKAETGRLGNEMSEDALSRNVFASLAVAGQLKAAANFLTDRTLSAEPDLYLWGKRIDIPGQEHGRFEPLWNVRALLEEDIHTFNTEPDIMLVVEGKIVICIEAKFGSGNSLAHDGKVKEGEKPTSRSALIERYLGNSTKASTRAAIHSEKIGPKLHTQLFRNIIFASEMATEQWHVVNLVSRTQHQLGKENPRSSFADPTSDVRRYLSPESESCFTYRTWEDLDAKLIKNTTELRDLAHYMRNKSAHFRPAFELS
jgi:hypothetical protein